MGDYDVLSERELESRYEVFVEQYIAKLNIESETTFSMAKTLLLPAAIRYLGELGLAGDSAGVGAITAEVTGLARRVRRARSRRSATANASHPEGERARRGEVRPAAPSCRRWTAVREVADQLERVVPDSLWPLPKYSEILFIK